MVTSVTSLSRSGVSDWFLQRVSAVILLAWTLYLGATLLGGVDYAQWKALFEPAPMKIFTLLAILSLAAHAWIGMWTVGTDYLTGRLLGRSGNILRIAFQVACGLIIFVYVVWGIQILWG